MKKVIVTGANGFVGKNLVAALKNIKDGKDRTHPNLNIEEIYTYDIDSSAELLEEACKNADFVFNLAGVNRPQNTEEFMQGNFGFASTLTVLPTLFLAGIIVIFLPAAITVHLISN